MLNIMCVISAPNAYSCRRLSGQPGGHFPFIFNVEFCCFRRLLCVVVVALWRIIISRQAAIKEQRVHVADFSQACSLKSLVREHQQQVQTC